MRVLQYVYRSGSNRLEIYGRRKMNPNHFLLFSKELREKVPKGLKVSASVLNKFAGYLWNEKMTDKEREFWRERSQKAQLTPEEKELTDYIRNNANNAAKSHVNQLNDCSRNNAAKSYRINRLNDCPFKEYVKTRSVLKSDPFLTTTLELNWSI